MTAGDRAALGALAATRAAPGGGYRIGPDDLLDIRIPDLLVASPSATRAAPELSAVAPAPVFQQGTRVDSRGEVQIPLLGMMRAEGLTATELEAEIARRLTAAGILRRPQVSVQIAEYRSRVVAVIGSVERPGLYPVTRPAATLADLIWAAGGPSKDAGRVVSFAPAGENPIRVDLRLLLDAAGAPAPELNPQVRPGDVISIAPAGTVQVAGWVEKPGSYPVTRGLTLTGAVAAAGGERFPADLHRATVKRVLGSGEHRSFEVDLAAVAEGRTADMPIADGDVVNLPASRARVVPWAFWTAARELVHVGGSVPLF